MAALRRAVSLAAVLLCAVPAVAQDPEWVFEGTPYFWASGASGTVGIAGLPELEVDASFSDVMKNFDIGVLGRLEGRKDRLGFSTDLVYLNLGMPLAEGQPVIGTLGPEIDLRQFMGEGVGFYRLARSQGDPDGAWLDVLGGVRYTHARTEMELVDGSLAESSVDLVDAIGGLRGRLPLGSRAALLVRGDVGGGTSKIAWNAEATLSVPVSKSWRVGAGYRHLHQEYRAEPGENRPTIDLTLKGPVLLVTNVF